jgi:branched-chain amino acid transport system permease protein
LFRRLLKNFRFDVLPVPGRVIAIIFFIFLFFFPLITQNSYYMRMMINVSIFAIFAVSWDLLGGYTGQVNFGHALFFGVAGYTSALLFNGLGWPLPATMIVGILAGVAAGVVTCFPALKLRGPYLSLLTLAFPLMLVPLILYFRRYTGGEYGLHGLPLIAESLAGRYYICLIVMILSVLIMWKLTDAGSRYVRTGLIFHAIREDEIAARATGINTIRYKLLAFSMGGFFAGLAGVLYAHTVGSASIGMLSLTMSFQVIIWVIFGGIVSIYGGVVGVYLLYPLVYLSFDIQTIFENIYNAIPDNMGPLQNIVAFFRQLTIAPMIVLAAIVILVLLFMPEGLAVIIRNKMERECPRCKLTNGAWRRECRACGASLR